MNMKNIILSVLFWAVASVSMAVVLPSSSFYEYSGDAEMDLSFVSNNGVSFLGQSAVTVRYEGTCTYEAWNGDVSGCQKCCETEFTCGDEDYDCWDLKGACMDQCGDPLGGVPLGSPLLLLPFIAIYAVIRKRKENAEQA